MINTSDATIAADLAAFEAAMLRREAAHVQYLSACQRFDWVGAETYRIEVLAWTEAAMDGIGRACRRLEAVTHGGK